MLHVMTVDLIQVHQSQRVPADLGFKGYVDLSSYNLDDVMGTNIWKSLKKKAPSNQSQVLLFQQGEIKRSITFVSE